jgi:hypothetical protein
MIVFQVNNPNEKTTCFFSKYTNTMTNIIIDKYINLSKLKRY